jgi:uridine phosphorylase
MENRKASDAPADEGGRQYHIGLAPGEVAETVLLVGDPARVQKGAELLESPSPIRSHREYACTTGTYAGRPVSVLGTGIGTDNTEIAVVELSRLVDPESTVLIRVGSSGAISPEVEAGDLVVATGGFRLESTSLAYVDPGFPAIAHHDVIRTLTTACEEAHERFHVGLTASAPGFFGAQGRPVEGLPLRWPDRVERLAAQRVINMEMECSTLFTLATLFGMRAGAVCAVFADRNRGAFLDAEGRAEAERRALRVALEAIARL